MRNLIDFLLFCGIIANIPLLFQGTNFYAIVDAYINYIILSVF